MSLVTNENYYQLLGVSETATYEEIRQSYHDVCRRFHPDKQAAGGRLTPEQLEFWSALQTAWKCLSNDVRRVIYDIRRAGKPLSVEDKARVQKLQQEQAARDIANMQLQYQQSLERERQKNGIVVIRALFGDLRKATRAGVSTSQADDDSQPAPLSPGSMGHLNKENMGDPTNISKDDQVFSPSAKSPSAPDQFDSTRSADIELEFNIQGPVLDVIVPIQCCVDGHRVILASGIGKSDLPGFYNPTIFHHASPANVLASPSVKPSSTCSLYVLYKFKGVVHEVNVSDTEALWLPLRSHAITGEKELTGPAPPPVPTTPVGSVCRASMRISEKNNNFEESSVSGLPWWVVVGVSVIGVAGIAALVWRSRR